MAIKELKIDFEPREWQKKCMSEMKRFTVLALHRRAGKTTLAVALLLSAAFSKKGNYVYVSPQKNQSRTNMWDLIKGMLKEIIEAKTKPPLVEIYESDLSIRFQNGSKIWLLGAEDPDKIRGAKISGAVVDEVAQMPREVWSEVLRPALMDTKGFALFIGTPKGINLFSELFDRGRNPEYEDEWASYAYTCYQTGAIPPEEIENYKKEVDINTFRREMLCDFSASAEDQMINMDLVEAAMSRQPDVRELSTGQPLVMGVDIARYGDDSTCIFFRRGPVAEPPILAHHMSVPENATFIYHYITERNPKAVFIDGTGIGGGVFDILQTWGAPVYDINFGSRSIDPRYKNRRAEMWGRMADWLRLGGCLPRHDKLKQELCAPLFIVAEDGRIALESKNDIRKRLNLSPDVGDALALTFAEKIGPDKVYNRDEFGEPIQRTYQSALSPIQRFERRHRRHVKTRR